MADPNAPSNEPCLSPVRPTHAVQCLGGIALAGCGNPLSRPFARPRRPRDPDSTVRSRHPPASQLSPTAKRGLAAERHPAPDCSRFLSYQKDMCVCVCVCSTSRVLRISPLKKTTPDKTLFFSWPSLYSYFSPLSTKIIHRYSSPSVAIARNRNPPGG